jgi:hypothetical protein
MKCPSCGANQPDRAICEYCGRAMPVSTQTPWEAPQAALHAVGAATKTGRTALIFSIVSLWACCFPLSIVGIVLGLRARREAAQSGTPPPATATIAIVLSVLPILMTVAFAIWFTIDSIALSKRIDELNARIPGADTAEQLGQQTACDLAELRIRTDGWNDDDPIVIDGFECPGRVEQRGDEAQLPDFSFNASGNARVTVTVCYKRGARWTVDEIRENGGCFE